MSGWIKIYKVGWKDWNGWFDEMFDRVLDEQNLA